MKRLPGDAHTYSDIVAGLIAQRPPKRSPWLQWTPGIQQNSSGDHLGQQYRTPTDAIVQGGSDLLIVGRGILHAQDPIAAAKSYQEEAWEALMTRQHATAAER